MRGRYIFLLHLYIDSLPDPHYELITYYICNGFVGLAIAILSKTKVQPNAAINGVQFPEKPAFYIECRLLAPRLAFQKLIQAPRGGQLKLHGNIYVPVDVNTTISLLPRLPRECGMIKVKLKRRLLNVWPHGILQAAQ